MASNMNQPEIDTEKPHIHIRPKKGWQVIDLGELRQYRDLFYFLVIRDIRVTIPFLIQH
jgi:lipopolysaccharide transport system permease protein